MHTYMCIICTYPRMHVVAHTGTCTDTRACLCTHTAPTNILHVPTPTHVGIRVLAHLSPVWSPVRGPASTDARGPACPSFQEAFPNEECARLPDLSSHQCKVAHPAQL